MDVSSPFAKNLRFFGDASEICSNFQCPSFLHSSIYSSFCGINVASISIDIPFFLQVPKHAYEMIYKFTRGQSLIPTAPSTATKGEPAAVLRAGRKDGPFVLTSEQ